MKKKNATRTISVEGRNGSNSLIKALKSDKFDPEDFLSANPKISSSCIKFLKKIYDHAKSSENNFSINDPLNFQTESLKFSNSKKKKKKQLLSSAEAPVPSLIIEDFDEDQIWEEVEVQNRFIYDNLVSGVSKLLAYQEKSLQVLAESDIDEESLPEEENSLAVSLVENENDEDDETSRPNFFESDETYSRKQTNQIYPKSVVDDKFFSLAQMTEHIERIEAEEYKAASDNRKDSNLDDEDDIQESENIDLFADVSSDESEEEVAEYYYKDFFDPPLDGSSSQRKEKQDTRDDKDMNFRNEEEDEDDGLDENDEPENPPEEVSDESSESELDEGKEEDENNYESLKSKISSTLSAFEKRKLNIEEKIEEIENEALQPKSWHLLGETTGESRPENALLEEHLIYDHLIRPAPEITVETTMKLEDVIKQRIKDGVWDDVLRKVRPVEDPREYKKRMVLDAEKSKASLAEVYEKEYLEQKRKEDGHTEEKEPEEHSKIRNDLKVLFQKLDSLSHFHFTPKPPPPEVKIITNAPSISIEETAGVSVSDANMLAPQEIQDHAKGSIKGKGEKTDTDRKRERRKKKKKQHLKRLMQEEKARAKGIGLRNIKLAEGIVKSQQKDGKDVEGYTTSNQSAKELKSSKAFFAKLQQSAASHIDKVSKRKRLSNDNESRNLSAKKYKL